LTAKRIAIPVYNLGMVDGDVPFWVRGSVFMDYGEVFNSLAQEPILTHLDYWGAGVGVTAAIGSHLDAKIIVGWPLLNKPIVKAGETHVYFSIGAQF
jgi:hemolysin activation/secretion protein